MKEVHINKHTRTFITKFNFLTHLSPEQEQMEKKKAEYGEKMKNKIGSVHKQAEEKRAMVEAKRGEEFLKAEELAAKFRATGTTPKKHIGCF
ncbi:putative remorin [Lupinus albus]|uniref:Putative remorin n=1 Tax=Lupinus albus TaxID=3870 RepID=A0A6A4NP57_LUPAL|nr:putative remorin [Lupinus albus]